MNARTLWLTWVFAHSILFSFHGWAQPYPPGYFTFPIMPGKPNFIVGTMGELRPSHFHSGLDIKTLQREGLSVYAGAEGYVSRVKVSTGGYGNALYITHPNGLVTVYAHLRTFSRAIGDYVRQRQYARQSFEIELVPQPYELAVLRGEVVGFSGNTGSSGGPHLHYEVRDAKENALNPLAFGFREITDNVPPAFDKVGLRTLDAESRVNGEFGRVEFTPKRTKAGTYVLTQPIVAYGRIGLEVLVHDKANGLDNRNGVNCVEVTLDGREIYAHQLDRFAFAQSRHLNVHTDYATGSRFQRCYLADGNALPIYRLGADQGRLLLRPQSTHRLTVTLWDAYQNQTRLEFTVKGQEPVFSLPTLKINKLPPSLAYSVDENTLVIKAKNIKPGANSADLYVQRKPFQLPIAFYRNGEATYLWDLRRGLPDSVSVGGTSLRLPFRQVIPPKTDLVYGNDSLRIAFNQASLFDTLYLSVARAGDEIIVNTPAVPLLDGISVGIKPRVPGWDQTRTLAYLVRGAKRQCLGGTWINGQLNFRTRELGTFTLATDVLPPTVRLVKASADGISFRIGDDLSGIASYQARINGKWLLMNYDYKRGLIWSEKPDPIQPLRGTFALEVKDLAGNTQVFSMSL
ncbi:MAG: M23 family metallopeptidase [Ferruginibacter sp.]|nr:M23 family metallopeptidase [Cytophagales bacterium]